MPVLYAADPPLPFNLNNTIALLTKIVASENPIYFSYFIVEYIWPGQPHNLDLITRRVFVLKRSEDGRKLQEVCRGRTRAFRLNLARERNQFILLFFYFTNLFFYILYSSNACVLYQHEHHCKTWKESRTQIFNPTITNWTNLAAIWHETHIHLSNAEWSILFTTYSSHVPSLISSHTSAEKTRGQIRANRK